MDKVDNENKNIAKNREDTMTDENVQILSDLGAIQLFC